MHLPNARVPGKRGGKAAPHIATAVFAAAFALVLAAPVEISLSGDHIVQVSGAPAHARGGNGGGNGGGGGNAGGNGGGKGKGKGGGAPSASSGSDDTPLQTPQAEHGVTIAQITTAIVRRYPANEISTLSDLHQPISFFTEVSGMNGRQVTHRWYHGNDLVFETSFPIRNDVWRVWSTQQLPEGMPGAWTLAAVDEANDVLAARGLTFQPDGEGATAPQEPAPGGLGDVVGNLWNALKQ